MNSEFVSLLLFIFNSTMPNWSKERTSQPFESEPGRPRNMNLQVLPLKELVTRQVLKNRMDYSTYLNGIAKEELDILENLAGKFRIMESEVIVREWPSEKPLDWRTTIRLPKPLIKFLYGTAVFSIEEQMVDGEKTWIISDVNGEKEDLMPRRWKEQGNLWIHEEGFIEDGKLVHVTKATELHNGKMRLWLDLYDSFTVDREGNLFRKFIYIGPQSGIKVTRTMRALRIDAKGTTDPSNEFINIFGTFRLTGS